MGATRLYGVRPFLHASCVPALKLARCPRFDSCAPAHIDLSVCPSMSLAPPRLHSRCYPAQLCLDHSVAAATSRQLPWLRCRLPTRLKLVRSHLTCRYPRGFAFCVASSKAPFPIAACSMSRIPFAPFLLRFRLQCARAHFLTLSTLRATQPSQPRIIDQPFLPCPVAGYTGPSR